MTVGDQTVAGGEGNTASLVMCRAKRRLSGE